MHQVLYTREAYVKGKTLTVLIGHVSFGSGEEGKVEVILNLQKEQTKRIYFQHAGLITRVFGYRHQIITFRGH